MRGIEGALQVLEQTRQGGKDPAPAGGKSGGARRSAGNGVLFASEVLRKLSEDMTPGDRTLASSLVYAVLRRQEMWRAIYEKFLKDPRGDESLPPFIRDCLLLGTAGLLELRHFAGGVLVNGLLDHLKARSQKRWVPLVNAVLHNVGEKGAEQMEALRRSPAPEERALWAGVPVWSLPAWTRTWQRPDLNRLFDLMPLPPRSSLRPAPGKRDELLKVLGEHGMKAEPSPLSEAVHLEGTVLPAEVPGFDRGDVTVQTEGSILAASLAARLFKGGGCILDLCSGRGVKGGQVLQMCPDARLEGWELSEGRHKSALREMRRLGVAGRAKLRRGSALELEPLEPPSLVMLDAPCSGSGTWTRKPDSKWRLDWDRLDRLSAAQRNLLERAVALCAPRGIILYITCSLLRQENENVVAEVLAAHPECAELPVSPEDGTAAGPSEAAGTRPFHRGRPWGTYIWPETPWLDGFYCAVIMKK
ncbi:MAG: RsmB/NOP family class I SAM-dependent RNA methyltransferase [Fretibacterium sp.]|nr:RsmB/NOP family class I SAM-dependent RNA methyltransferase [Fretibacterium sp.]